MVIDPPTIRVVVVDDAAQPRSAVKEVLDGSDGFVFAGGASSSREAVNLVLRTRPDLVLLDIEMPEAEGLETARLIRDASPDLKVVAWTNHAEPAAVTEMIAAGASGYLLKSASREELLQNLRWASRGQSVLSREITSSVLTELSRLYQDATERADELRTSYLNTIDSLATALETKDDQTGNHARRVRDYAAAMAQAYDHSLVEDESLEFGFLLHDVGKIGIPEQILMKPGPLDEGEWAIMRKHPEMGARILGSIRFLQGAAMGVVLSHHERWDGNGYPNKLSGEDIPVGARIFAVADAFDAMTQDRPYRKALPIEAAVQEIVTHSGSQFDPAVVDVFLSSRDEIEDRMAKGNG